MSSDTSNAGTLRLDGGARPEWPKEEVTPRILANQLGFAPEIHPTEETAEQIPWVPRAKPLAGLDGVQEEELLAIALGAHPRLLYR
ncbi:MAG: hypothetical protein ACI81R_000035 [Bradymonadia bacterium]|jgi:hypothetical protein